MAFGDLRSYLNFLEEKEELARVRPEVDIRYEAGAVCRRVNDARGPAVMFEKPAGSLLGESPKTFDVPLVANLLGSRERVAMALDMTLENFHQEWIRRTERPIEPRMVKTGPCKENIILGEDVDLRRFPIPTWNRDDGGPYITYPCQITVDPVTGARNSGMYRSQVHSPNTIGILAGPYRHLAQQWSRAPQDQPFPVAIALGLDPAVHIASVAFFPAGVDEMAMAGGLRGEPVDMVRCETIPVDVPASAEIVLEGELLPGVLHEEGPFGEFTGYYGIRIGRPVIRIKAITHRNNPIWLGSYIGRPPTECSFLMNYPMEAEILRQIQLPGIRGICITEGGCSFNAVVSVAKPIEGYGKMIGMSVLATWPGRMVKTVIVVDEDVDPYDSTQVEWALGTRVQPHRDVEILQEVSGTVLDPSLSHYERSSGKSRTSKMIIDATRYDATEYEVTCAPEPSALHKVDAEWARYGLSLKSLNRR